MTGFILKYSCHLHIL